MDVAMVVESFPKGSETFLLHQITGLLDSGVNVELYASHRNEKETVHEQSKSYDLLNRVTYADFPDPKIRRAVGAVPLFIQALRKAPELTIQALNSSQYGIDSLNTVNIYRAAAVADDYSDYDVIHAHFGPQGNDYRWWFDSTSTPVVVSFYGYDASLLLNQQPSRYDALFKRVDCITVLTDDMRRDLTAVGCPPEKIRKQPLAISTEQFSYQDRENHQPPVEILSVGRFVEKKGFQYGVDAIAKLTQNHDITYRIAGDGPLRETLEKRAQKHGIVDSVEFLGFVEQSTVVELMQSADIFLAPSVTSVTGNKEGTPTVLLEAQSTGLPVISTYHAGIPEIVHEDESGLLVPERDVDAISTALRELINDKQKRIQMSQYGRRLIEETHSIPAMVERLLSIYTDVT